ncbi:MAG: cupin domain-containing protein [Thermoanaerobaculia bacterium]
MSLKPGEDIGEETHDDLDQFTRIEQGRGLVQMGSERKSVPQASHACVSSRAARLRPADGVPQRLREPGREAADGPLRALVCRDADRALR